MKTIVIYESVHHGNTKKIADVIAKTLGADEMKAEDVNIDAVKDYDVIGFGSGIFYGSFHKSIIKIIDSLPDLKGKKVFIFTTSGRDNIKYNDSIKEKLESHNLEIIGNFACGGFDTFGPLKLMGGISKGRPNEEDLKNAEKFAENIKETQKNV